MKIMFRMLQALLAIQTSTIANGLIFYIRKIPYIGRRIPESLYAHQAWKRVLAVISRILILLSGFASRLAYVGIMLYLPVTALGADLPKEAQLQQFAHLFLLLSFVVGSVSNAAVLETKRSKYIAVKLMRMSPARYMRTTLSYKYVTFVLYLLPAMLLFGTRLGGAVWLLVMLTLSIALWRVWSEYLHLKLFEKTGHVLIKNTAVVWTVIMLGYAAAYVPVWLGSIPQTGAWLMMGPVHLVSFAAGGFAIYRLARYRDYRTVVDAATRRDDPLLDIGRMVKEANQTSVKSKDSDYTLHTKNVSKLTSKAGYRYLNALFFARHRSLVRRPVQIRLAIIAALGLAGIGLVFTLDEAADLLLANMDRVIAWLFLVMMNLAVGEKLCKAMFHHCDYSLLRYSYYRQDAWQHFRIRLMMVTGRNLVMAAALGVALTAVYIAAGGNPQDAHVGLLWLAVLSLAALFSVHHLFMYYILQPYTADLNLKNPLYFVIFYIFSMIGGICLFIRVPAQLFTSISLAVTAIYFAIALILVRRYGSRTFRVK